MGRVIITRSQLGRVTRWFLAHHHYHHPLPPPPPSSTTITSSIKQCSTRSEKTSSYFSEKQEKTLPEHIVILTCSSTAPSGFCVVYLVGTCHISKRSCLEVETVIDVLKPEVVFLELCQKRKASLTTKHLKEPTVKEILAVMMNKKTNILGMLINLMYKQIAAKLKIIPGSEFRVAYEEATKYGGKVVLGDRPLEITLARAWRKMSFSEKMRLFSLHDGKDGSTSIEDLCPSIKDCSSITDILLKLDMAIDEMDITRLIHEMSKISPTLVETLLHERDQYMSYALLHMAKKSQCIVAVVGKAHLEGIKKHWQQPISIKDLLSVPPPPEPIMSAKFLISVSVFMAGVAVIWRCL